MSQHVVAWLLDCGTVALRTELSFLGHRGAVVRGGWIDDLESGESFPDIETWVNKIARQEGQKHLVKGKKNREIWSLIKVLGENGDSNETLQSLYQKPVPQRSAHHQHLQPPPPSTPEDLFSDLSPKKTPTRSTSSTSASPKKAVSPKKSPKSKSTPTKSPTKEASSPTSVPKTRKSKKKDEQPAAADTNKAVGSTLDDVNMLMNIDKSGNEDATVAPSDDSASDADFQVEKDKPTSNNSRKRKEPPVKETPTKPAPKASPAKKARRGDSVAAASTAAADVTSSELSEPMDTAIDQNDDMDFELDPKVQKPSSPVRRRQPKAAAAKNSPTKRQRVISTPSASQEPAAPAPADETVAPSSSVNSPPASPSLEFVDMEDPMHDHAAFLSELKRITSAEDGIAKDASTVDPSEAASSLVAPVAPTPAPAATSKASPSKQSPSKQAPSPKAAATAPTTSPSRKPTTHAVILTTGLRSQMISIIQILVEKLGGRLVDSYVEQVTHVVTLVDSDGYAKRTVKYCAGVLAGAWVVSFDWIMASMQAGAWANEEPYEIKSDVVVGAVGGSKAIPRLARQTVQDHDRLFKGWRFFFAGEFGTPSKQELLSLADAGHAYVCPVTPTPPKTTKEMMNAQHSRTVVICDPSKVKEEEARELFFKTGKLPVSVRWLLDGISFYRPLRPQDYYLISEAKANGSKPISTSSSSPLQTQMSQEV